MDVVTIFFSDCSTFDNLEVYSAWVHAPVVSPKTIKDVVYTPIGSSPIISVMVCAHFGVHLISTKTPDGMGKAVEFVACFIFWK